MAEAATATLPDSVQPVPLSNPRRSGIPDALSGTDRTIGTGATALQSMLNSLGTTLQPGDTITCPNGAVYNPITLPARSDANWIRIRSQAHKDGLLPAGTQVTPSDTGKMFKVLGLGLNATDPFMVVPANTQGWQIIGMEGTWPRAVPLNEAGALGYYVGLDLWGRRFSLERSYIHPFDALSNLNLAIYDKGSDNQFWDSWLVAHADATGIGNESHAIFISVHGDNQPAGSPGRHHIENCEGRATGQVFMSGDQGSPSPPPDISILRNHLYNPIEVFKQLPNGTTNSAWNGKNWIMKNLFEIKTCQRLLLEGNTLENFWGGNAAEQNGEGIVLNYGGNTAGVDATLTHLTVRSNTFIQVENVMTVSTGYVFNSPPLPTLFGPITVTNNLGLGILGTMMFLNWANYNVRFEHNTMVPQLGTPRHQYWGGFGTIQSGRATNSGFKGTSTDSMVNLTVKRNITGWAGFGIDLLSFDGGGLIPPTNATLNGYFASRVWAENAVFNNGGGVPSDIGITLYASATSAGISTSTGVLTSNSPLKAAGTDGKDLGVDFVALAAAQAGIRAQILAQQTAGTLTVVFAGSLVGATASSYAWTFGDTATSTLQNPSHTYTTANINPGYHVTLDVTSSGGTHYTISQDVAVIAPGVPPTITITTPTSSATWATSEGTLDLSGTASDDTGISRVTWSNDRGGKGTATGTTTWSVSAMTLQSGVNIITATALDLDGNASNDVLTVTYTPIVVVTLRRTRLGATSKTTQ